MYFTNDIYDFLSLHDNCCILFNISLYIFAVVNYARIV